MNIFYLARDPRVCAQYHCDKHVVKMILETAQILTAVHYHYGNGEGMTYKCTHANHPSTLWAGDSSTNYSWLWHLGYELCKEYTVRYGKRHKCQDMFEDVRQLECRPRGMPSLNWTPPPQCMPDEYKNRHSTINAYRAYYLGNKRRFAKWSVRSIPSWWRKGLTSQ